MTTAGSLALVAPSRAGLIRRQKLRAAGAVILGKTNLSEWPIFAPATPPAAGAP